MFSNIRFVFEILNSEYMNVHLARSIKSASLR